MSYMEQSLGQLARRIPGATALFNTYQLDFCCAGNRSLRTAIEGLEIDASALVEGLQTLETRATSEQGMDLADTSDTQLVQHLLERYHAVHREQLPELIRLARRVELVHGDREDCPHGLADHLEAMSQELESHMRKEEMVLFPMIMRGQGEMASMPIAAMRAEHDDHGTELRRLEALTHDIQPPRDACTTWRALYTGLRSFREDLMQHIHTENNILFERFAPAQVL